MRKIKIKTKSLATTAIAFLLVHAPLVQSGSIDADKKLHYQVSAIIGSGLYFMHNAYDSNNDEDGNKVISAGFALTACGATGLAKEFYDEYQSSGFDGKDMMANLAGCLTGTYAAKVINESIRITPTFDYETDNFSGIQISKIF